MGLNLSLTRPSRSCLCCALSYVLSRSVKKRMQRLCRQALFLAFKFFINKSFVVKHFRFKTFHKCLILFSNHL